MSGDGHDFCLRAAHLCEPRRRRVAQSVEAETFRYPEPLAFSQEVPAEHSGVIGEAGLRLQYGALCAALGCVRQHLGEFWVGWDHERRMRLLLDHAHPIP